MNERPQPQATGGQTRTPTPQDRLAALFRRLSMARLGRLFATPERPAKHSRAHTKAYYDGRQKRGGKVYARLQRQLKTKAQRRPPPKRPLKPARYFRPTKHHRITRAALQAFRARLALRK